MKRIITMAITLCIILLATSISPVRADSWIQSEPFYILSEDGSRIFHVTPSCQWSQENIINWAHYPSTGLYYNTDPPVLIYLVENPCTVLHEFYFIFSRDMRHFAWLPAMNASGGRGYAPGEAGPLAMAFYANGTPQRRYLVADLIREPEALRRTVSTVTWDYWEERSFDPDTNLLTVLTLEQVVLVFDITTGEIVETRDLCENYEVEEDVMVGTAYEIYTPEMAEEYEEIADTTDVRLILPIAIGMAMLLGGVVVVSVIRWCGKGGETP